MPQHQPIRAHPGSQLYWLLAASDPKIFTAAARMPGSAPEQADHPL